MKKNYKPLDRKHSTAFILPDNIDVDEYWECAKNEMEDNKASVSPIRKFRKSFDQEYGNELNTIEFTNYSDSVNCSFNDSIINEKNGEEKSVKDNKKNKGEKKKNKEEKIKKNKEEKIYKKEKVKKEMNEFNFKIRDKKNTDEAVENDFNRNEDDFSYFSPEVTDENNLGPAEPIENEAVDSKKYRKEAKNIKTVNGLIVKGKKIGVDDVYNYNINKSRFIVQTIGSICTGVLILIKGAYTEKQKIDYSMVVSVLKGKIELVVNEVEFIVRKGAVVCIKKDEKYSIKNIGSSVFFANLCMLNDE